MRHGRHKDIVDNIIIFHEGQKLRWPFYEIVKSRHTCSDILNGIHIKYLDKKHFTLTT